MLLHHTINIYFLVQSHIGQEEGKTTMVDNSSMTAPAKVTYNTTEFAAAPTQVTTPTQNSMDTTLKKLQREKWWRERR